MDAGGYARPFDLTTLGYDLPPGVRGALERVLGLTELNERYRALDRDGSARGFVREAVASLGLRFACEPEPHEQIPRAGPVIVVANHPFGGVEALALLSLLLEVRADSKVMANYVLSRIPDLRDACIYVDPFGAMRDAARNVAPLKAAVRWLREGHVLGVFPAGEVAHLDLSQRRVEEPDWSPHIAALAVRAGARVVPVYFAGGNGPLFQVAGLVNENFRTALLGRELLRHRNRTCRVLVGSPIAASTLAGIGDDAERAAYLRARTLLLERGLAMPALAAGRFRPAALLPRRREARPEPVHLGQQAGAVARELEQLPPQSQLAAGGGLEVRLAAAHEIPQTLKEIGRLREHTFRAVGEGTGREVDLDVFDRSYLHLVLWDPREAVVVGGYRLGPTDRLLPFEGAAGLYLSTLFRWRDDFLGQLDPAVELGRSFVRPSHQRSFAPLMLLWKGLGAFVARHTHYRRFVGPVSVSADYSVASRALIHEFLQRPEFVSPLGAGVEPRTPFRARIGSRRRLRDMARRLRSVEELSAVVADLEPDGKGVPVLLRQYLKLGAQTLAFNVDPDFADCLDWLCVLELTRTERRVLVKYMGKEAATAYLAAHGRSRHGAVA